MNTYGYVGGNPVGYTDRLGLAQDSITQTCLRNPALCKELHDALKVPPPIPPVSENSKIPDNIDVPGLPEKIDIKDTTPIVVVPSYNTPPSDQCDVELERNKDECKNSCTNVVSTSACIGKAMLRWYVCKGSSKYDDNSGGPGGESGYSPY